MARIKFVSEEDHKRPGITKKTIGIRTIGREEEESLNIANAYIKNPHRYDYQKKAGDYTVWRARRIKRKPFLMDYRNQAVSAAMTLFSMLEPLAKWMWHIEDQSVWWPEEPIGAAARFVKENWYRIRDNLDPRIWPSYWNDPQPLFPQVGSVITGRGSIVCNMLPPSQWSDIGNFVTSHPEVRNMHKHSPAELRGWTMGLYWERFEWFACKREIYSLKFQLATYCGKRTSYHMEGINPYENNYHQGNVIW